jgi:hypothetical protein
MATMNIGKNARLFLYYLWILGVTVRYVVPCNVESSGYLLTVQRNQKLKRNNNQNGSHYGGKARKVIEGGDRRTSRRKQK